MPVTIAVLSRARRINQKMTGTERAENISQRRSDDDLELRTMMRLFGRYLSRRFD